VRAQAALVSLAVDLVAVGLDGAGAQELGPFPREQRAILEEVDPDEAVRDENGGALRTWHDFPSDRGLHVLLVGLHLGLVVDRQVASRRRRRGRTLGVPVDLGPHFSLLAPLEHPGAKLGRGQDFSRNTNALPSPTQRPCSMQ